MAQKFNRTYLLKVDVDPAMTTDPDLNANGISSLPQHTETITLPFSCEFTVECRTLAQSSTATIRIYNLSQPTRDRLYKDPYWQTTTRRYLEFYGGYLGESKDEGFMPRIFYGMLLSCVSWRDGVNSITEFQATSMVWESPNADTNLTIAAGENAKNVLRKLNARMPGISPQPVIGESFVRHTYPTPFVLQGKVWQAIRQVSNGLAVIQNNTLVALNDDEVIQSSIPLINSSSGIIGTPKRGQYGVDLVMIFEPRLVLSQLVQLESSFNRNLNGTYKVFGYKHGGTISPRVAGNLQTELTLSRPGINYDPAVVLPSPAL